MANVQAASRAVNQGRVLALSTGVLWSLAGVFIKFLDLHPLTIVFYRTLFAALFFLIFINRRAWSWNFPLLVSVISYTANISTFVWANKLTTAANAIILQYTAPIFVFLLARVLFREAVSFLNWITLCFGMFGVGIIFAGSAGQPDLPGVGVAVLSGLLFSIYMINLRFLRKVDSGYLTLLNNLACCVLLLPLVDSFSLGIGEVLALVVMGVFQLGLPYFLFSKALEKIPLQEASLLVLVEPVLNPLWVALVYREVPSGATLIGGGMILASLGLRYLWPRLRGQDLA